MKMRVYYFGVLLTLFGQLGALCEPGGRFAVDTLKEDLLKIKQLVGLAIATPALDAVVMGAVEPGSEEIQAALQDAETCLTAAIGRITEEELLLYAEIIETYWTQFSESVQNDQEVTRSRKTKKLCRLFVQKACIRNLKAQDVTIFGTLIVDGVRIPSNDPFSRIITDNTDAATFDCLTFQKSRAGSAVLAGDTIGCINFQGFDGAAFSTGATIEAQVDGTPGVGDMPGRIIFSTSPDGTATPVERLRIDNAGLATFANSIDLPNTLSAAVGMFSKEGVRFLHNFGTDNTFLGVAAGNLTLAGEGNVGVGSGTLAALALGNFNVAVGPNAGQLISNGGLNTAIGSSALANITTANFNTALGASAGAALTSGDQNVFVGLNTGSGAATLDLCTLVGGSATASNGVVNATALGANTTVNASNKIRFGDAAITVIEGQVAYTFPSDERIKRNMQECLLGLAFVNKLQAIRYDKECGENLVTELGLSAQKVCAAAESCGCNFPGIYESEGILHMRYNDLFAPIIKAVQELSTEVNALKEEIAELKKAQ